MIQLRALDEACIVFQNEEMISFENTSNIQGLDQAMKSALKRSASAMKAFYKAVVRSVDKPGSGAHKAIAEKILESMYLMCFTLTYDCYLHVHIQKV